MDQPRLLFRQPNELSEGPLWDGADSTLYWLDIVAGLVWRSRLTGTDPAAAASWTKPESWSPSARIGALGLAAGGNFVGALEEGVGTFPWGGPVRLLAPLPFDGAKVCFNDGKVGPDGAFWTGAKDRAHKDPLAPLVRVRADGQCQVMETGLTIGNGLDWSPDGREFYLTDSIPRVIWRYRWDGQTGKITDRQIFTSGSEGPGVPDGLAVDTEGCVWTARWGGSQLVRVSSGGRVLDRIAFPVSRISSCTFGGSDLRTLFVTTAREDLGPADRRTEALAGSLFALTVPVPGQAARRFGA